MASFRACTPLAWGLASHPASPLTELRILLAFASGRCSGVQASLRCGGLHPDLELPVQMKKQARDSAAQINGSPFKGVRDAGPEREITLEVVC